MADTYLQMVDGEKQDSVILSTEVFTDWADAWEKYTGIIKGEIPAEGQRVRLANYRNGELKTIQETRL